MTSMKDNTGCQWSKEGSTMEMSLPKSSTKDPKVVGRSAGIDLGTSNSCIAILTSAGVDEVMPHLPWPSHRKRKLLLVHFLMLWPGNRPVNSVTMPRTAGRWTEAPTLTT